MISRKFDHPSADAVDARVASCFLSRIMKLLYSISMCCAEVAFQGGGKMWGR